MRKYTYTLAYLFLFFLIGCQSDDINRRIDEFTQIEVLSDGRLKVPLNFVLPEREEVEMRATTTPTTTEKTINNVFVIIFDQSTGNKVQLKSGLQDTADPKKVYAVLDPYSSACTAYVLVNLSTSAQTQLNAITHISGMSGLTDSYTILGQSTLPMCTAPVSLSSLSVQTLAGITYPLQFSYARIDVSFDASLTGFALAGVKIANAPQQGRLVVHTTLPIDLGGEIATTEKAATANTVQGIYLFSNSGISGTGNSQGTNFTDLIIRGTKTGFSQGYYKIRLKYNISGSDIYDIAHNKLYAIRLTKVGGPGYTTEAEAIANEPSNIEFDVIVSDGSSEDITIGSGDYYLGVSNSEYYIYADNALGVTATTLSYNAPSSVSTGAITVTGTGVTLSASQPGLNINGTNTAATLTSIDGTVRSIPIKVDLTAASTGGTLQIRLGNLLKTVTIVKKAYLNEAVSNTIAASDYTGSEFIAITSQSSRISVNADKSLTVAAASGPSNTVLSTATGICNNTRGNVVIAVKRNVENVIYYEKYADGSIGVFLDKSLANTLSTTASVSITEAGYGVVNTTSAASMRIDIGTQAFTSVSGASMNNLFSDYRGTLYGVNQESITALTQLATANQVKVNAVATKSYVYPNFAKGVYQGLGGATTTTSVTDGTSGSPFAIRTARHIRSLAPVITLTASKNFLQEIDVNFTTTAIGGAASFTTFPVAGTFLGIYDGGNKKLTNLIINSTANYVGLFQQSSGTLKNWQVENCNVKATQSVGTLAGACIQGSLLDNITLNNCIVEATSDYVGGIAGQIFGNNTSKTVVNSCNINNSTVKSRWRVGGVAGFINSFEFTDGVTVQYVTVNSGTNITGGGWGNDGGIGGIAGSAHNGGTITNCTNYGSIEATEYSIVGGFVGDMEGSPGQKAKIKFCNNYGTITTGPTASDGHRTIGGIAGHFWTDVDAENCTNYGTINAKAHPAGGIVGHIWYNNSIVNCVNQGTIISTSTAADQRIGGMVGWTESGPNTITNCINNVALNGRNYTGGIIGYAYTSTITITGCMNTQPITAVSGTTYYDYVGGIVGQNDGTITGCYVSAATTATANAVRGKNYIGGITGYNNGTVTHSYVVDTNASPTLPYAVGSTSTDYNAGVVGYNAGTNSYNILIARAPETATTLYPISGGGNASTNSFYLKGTSFNTKAIFGGGTGQTTAVFTSTPAVGVAPWSSYWERVAGYEYPKLIRYSAPSIYPIVN